VAAINLAKRVAEELGEEEPGGTVGFRIGGENIPGERIDFCTVGYLLQLFTNVPDEFGKYTHIVLDEVHERTAESDMLCLVVRLLVRTRFHHTRVTVMSATLQGDLFADYFSGLANSTGGPTKIFVGARCFPVKEHFLEDIVSVFGCRFESGSAINRLQRDMFPTGGDKTKKTRINPNHIEKLQEIALDLVRCVAEKGTTILVFLPGIAEISSLWEQARSLEDSGAFKVFPLHSMIPREEQELVFEDPALSVTLPNVVAVLDFGLHRRVDHDEKRGVSALVTKWISRAAATQRSGRAGRTRPGMCIRIFTRDWFDNVMVPFEQPESASMPLDRLYLSAKQLCEKLSTAFGDLAPHTAENVLQQLVQPPDLTAITKARDLNAELGIITAANERAAITSLGRVCLQLPIELRVARLVWLGFHWGVVADAVVLATVLSSLDIFTSPSPLFTRNEAMFIERLQASASCRMLFDGGWFSEPLMARQVFLEWLLAFHAAENVWGNKDYIFRARRRHTDNFSWRFSLSRGRMEHMISQTLDLAVRTMRLCGPGSQANIQLRGLVGGLGYEINGQGDLSGISWDSWKPLVLEGIFEVDVTYLKGLLAAAFSDQLLIGSYGSVPRDMDAPIPKLDRQEALLKAMYENQLQPRRTLVFPGNMEKPEAYVDFICGGPSKPSKPGIPVTACGSKCSLVELQEEEPEWEVLRSRSTSEKSDSRVLRCEFGLLHSFDRSMRELEKAKVSSGWTYGKVDIQHPCRLHWEWMQHVFVPNSGKTRKGPMAVRCEATCDKKNALGFMAHLQHLQDNAGMRNVAMLAVAAQAHGSEVPGRVFPTGVTLLTPGHIAFVLATVVMKTASFGLRSIGFTTSGALAILHRSISLPTRCVDSARWELICQLRYALRCALAVPDLPKSSWLRGSAGTLLADSAVEPIVRRLFEALPLDRGADTAKPDEENPSVATLAAKVVNLAAHDLQDGPAAFWPLATWDEVNRRRHAIDRQIDRLLCSQPPPAKRARKGGSVEAASIAGHPVPGSSPAAHVAAGKNASKLLVDLCHRVVSMSRSICCEEERQLFVSTLEGVVSRGVLPKTECTGIQTVIKWAKEQNLSQTVQLGTPSSRMSQMLGEIKRQVGCTHVANDPRAAKPVGRSATSTGANSPQGRSSQAEVNAKRLPPYSREELLRFTARGLKELLKLRGLDANDCFEKIDLVEKVLGSTKSEAGRVA